jgi:hypothetical protein
MSAARKASATDGKGSNATSAVGVTAKSVSPAKAGKEATVTKGNPTMAVAATASGRAKRFARLLQPRRCAEIEPGERCAVT